MNLPRSASDLCIIIACPACNGNGGFGIRRETHAPSAGPSRFDPCGTCEGSGWQQLHPADLSAVQLRLLRHKLASLPPDRHHSPDVNDPIINLGKLLAHQWIESVAFPNADASQIDLIDKRGNVLRIFPEFKGGHFSNLNAVPIPPGS
jgi:hypothetical protein